MKPPVREWGLRDRGNVILIVGPPGTGKTVLAYDIADDLRRKRDVYCPMSERFGRPNYYRQYTGEWGHDRIVMLNDASLSMHARRYMSAGNVIRDMQTAVRRHNNLDVIYDVQNSGTLDVNALRAADCLIVKGPPSPLQIPTERPAVREKYEEAGESMGVWTKRNAYCWTHERGFRITGIAAPAYWNEDISEDDVGKRAPPWTRLRLP